MVFDFFRPFLGLPPVAPSPNIAAAPADDEYEWVEDDAANVAPAVDTLAITANRPLALSADFQAWLKQQGISNDFVRADVQGGSFGGKTDAAPEAKRTPVVFIHGNSDSALGTGGTFNGFAASRSHLLANGYSQAELYGTTWGPASVMQAANQRHDAINLLQVRRFIEAVLSYTGKDKVSVVSHSMGVTLARRAILGGTFTDPSTGKTVDLGPPLGGRIEVFIGIAGANRGLVAGLSPAAAFIPTISPRGGLFPGYPTPFGVRGQSDTLQALAQAEHYEGERVYSIWSPTDEVIGFGNIVYGAPTSRIPGQDGECRVVASHMGTKNTTLQQQLEWLR